MDRHRKKGVENVLIIGERKKDGEKIKEDLRRQKTGQRQKQL